MLHLFVFIALDDLAFGADGLGGKHARAMQNEPRIEYFLIELIDGFSVLLGDMCVAYVLAHDTGVLALGQRVIVALARARLGLLDAKFLENLRHRALDKLGAVIRVKTQNHKRELPDDRLPHW